jgi:hypothetical protein
MMVINYPFSSGKMAHQLNYCLKLLIDKGFWHNELLGIYYADSRPDSETFFWLNQRSNGSGLVFQQYEKYHFFEDTHNEDAIFGLEISYEKKTIFPILFFDVADAPNTVKGLFFQKATWFFWPFQAPPYFKKLKATISEVDETRLFFLSSKLFLLF